MKNYNKEEKEEVFVRRWAKKLKAFNLLGGKCTRCGIKDIRVIDFHHNGDKMACVNKFALFSWKIFWNEAKKCECICRNCHAKMHSVKNSRWQKRKLKILKMGHRKIICQKCGHSDPLSLEFHHRNSETKQFQISTAIRNCVSNITVADILNEIDKCDILCCNCHRIIQIKTRKTDKLMKLIGKKVDRIDSFRQNKPIDHTQVLKLQKKGLTVSQIARAMDCSAGAVCVIIKSKHKIVSTNSDEIKILKLNKKGLGSRAIAKIMNTSRGMVTYVLKTKIL